MGNPKTGAPTSDFPSKKITLCFSSPKAKPDTHARQGRNTDQAGQPAEYKLLRNSVDGAPWRWAMRSLPKSRCPSPSLWPSAHIILSVRFLSPRSPVPPETKIDMVMYRAPRRGPWRACRSSVSNSGLLVTGLSLQPTRTWAKPTDTCQPCPSGSKADLSGAHWRSLWRDFGSEKLWVRKDRVVSTCGTPPHSEGAKSCCIAPWAGSWLMLWILQPSGWHQAGTTAQACLATWELLTP